MRTQLCARTFWTFAREFSPSIRKGTIDRRKAIGLRTVVVLSSAAPSRGLHAIISGADQFAIRGAVSTEVTRRR